MKPKSTLKPEAPLADEPSAEECCVPVCGPDTCGGTSIPVSVKPLVKARGRWNPDNPVATSREDPAAGGCCEPVCGPDTCGE